MVADAVRTSCSIVVTGNVLPLAGSAVALLEDAVDGDADDARWDRSEKVMTSVTVTSCNNWSPSFLSVMLNRSEPLAPNDSKRTKRGPTRCSRTEDLGHSPSFGQRNATPKLPVSARSTARVCGEDEDESDAAVDVEVVVDALESIGSVSSGSGFTSSVGSDEAVDGMVFYVSIPSSLPEHAAVNPSTKATPRSFSPVRLMTRRRA